MSGNTDTVRTYLDGFNASDHEKILGCLTDDIVWTVYGAYRIEGKAAYDDNIEGPASKARRASTSCAWSSRTTR